MHEYNTDWKSSITICKVHFKSELSLESISPSIVIKYNLIDVIIKEKSVALWDWAS
jgi:hypothetical protein